MLNKLLFLFTLLLLSFTVRAEFNYQGKGKLMLHSGTEKPFAFGFSFKKYNQGYAFRFGQQEYLVKNLPSKYSIWITLKKGTGVFVQEFSKSYLEGFEWRLDNHVISLKEHSIKDKSPKGKYVLDIDGTKYIFKGINGQIDILFDLNGISGIETEGFVKDVDLND